MPGSADWGWPPAHPYFDKASGVAVPVLVLVLSLHDLDRQEVGVCAVLDLVLRASAVEAPLD